MSCFFFSSRRRHTRWPGDWCSVVCSSDLDIANELAYLQDRVPPFPSEKAMAIIEHALGASPQDLFKEFEVEPVASASIAQVHFAVLHSGQEVAVKVLRTGMRKVIIKDDSLLRLLADLVERIMSDGMRLM